MLRYCISLALFSALLATSSFAQAQISPPDVQNSNPAGLTLVPGTVAIPGVSGATNTGTIPLPGTAGSPGVLTVPTNSGVAGRLYPPAYYPTVPNSSATPAILPQYGGTYPATPVTPPGQPAGGIPTCLNVRYSYLCGR